MNELEICTEQLRFKYNELMRARKPWHKDTYSGDSFTKTAEICLELKAPPEIFIEAQFEGLVEIEKYQPNFLHTEIAKKKYLKFLDGLNAFVPPSDCNYVGLLQSQLIWLQDLIAVGYSVEDALELEDIAFKDWFRILITKEPNEKLLVKFKEKAFKEIQDDTDLFEFLKAQKNLDLRRLA